jgi:SPOC domain
MPLDTTIPQETPMTAKQIAGPSLGANSLLWKTLFPNDHLRIDGRVQVKKSTEYLTSVRFDTRKELYAVVFSPATEQDEGSFKALSDFLIQKEFVNFTTSKYNN